MIPHPALIAYALAGSGSAHPMGAWAMAGILGACFLGILGGAVAITTFLDRHRQAGTERTRRLAHRHRHPTTTGDERRAQQRV